MSAPSDNDTIAAVAPPPGGGGGGGGGRCGGGGGRGAETVAGPLPPPRQAALRRLRDEDGELLDHGLVLAFPQPHSYTGEDTVEFQLHGSPVLAALLLRRLVALGARLAEPGEFTRRAFTRGRLDLAQAEAVADLISSASAQAARAALRSLEGEFSAVVHDLVDELTGLRVRLEAGMDFPEEGVDALEDAALATDLEALQRRVAAVRAAAERGRVLHDGLALVLAGAPNAGKSSLLNRLAGYEAAIVTEIPGTTRDLVREDILVDGMPVRVIDTAGLRVAGDRVEAEGIRRALEAMRRADLVLLVEDASRPEETAAPPELPVDVPLLRVLNKIDLAGLAPGEESAADGTDRIRLSALTGAGLELLRDRLKATAGLAGETEGSFSARRRQLDSLAQAGARVAAAMALVADGACVELAAEELRLAQQALGEVTGQVTTEDLLGRIFAEFCIGK